MPSAPAAPGHGGVREYRDKSTGEQVKEKASEFSEAVEKERSFEGEADTIRESLHQQMDLVGAILTVVIAGAAAYAGINVMSQVGSTMSLTSNDTFYPASQALGDGIDSFFTQLPTVFVVIALVLIISYLTILRQR
jgi:hypothetical protein